MPETLSSGMLLETTETARPNPGLEAALYDADTLLNYAAGKGQLSGSMIGELALNIVLARQALRANQLAPNIATAFWGAYAHLANLTRPVTADSIRASEAVSFRGAKVTGIILVTTILILSILAFVSNTVVSTTRELIERQNAAALKLASSLQVLRTKAPEAGGPALADAAADLSDPIFVETVQFSVNSRRLLQTARKLHWFSPWSQDISVTLLDFDDRGSGLQVPPTVSTRAEIEHEVARQVEAYQLIRNRQYVSADTRNGTRYLSSTIAGLAVGMFSASLHQSLSLSPLAIAFLVGYSIEHLFSLLDKLVIRPGHWRSVAHEPAGFPSEAELPSEEEDIEVEDIDNADHIANYKSLMSRAVEAYGRLSFVQAIRTFPQQPLYFAAAALGILGGRYAGIVGIALAEPSTFTPPLGLSQGTFSGIVVLFAALFAILVVGLFWAGYVAKPKSHAAAAVVQHLVTFLSGALLGLKV